MQEGCSRLFSPKRGFSHFENLRKPAADGLPPLGIAADHCTFHWAAAIPTVSELLHSKFCQQQQQTRLQLESRHVQQQQRCSRLVFFGGDWGWSTFMNWFDFLLIEWRLYEPELHNAYHLSSRAFMPWLVTSDQWKDDIYSCALVGPSLQ